MTSLQVAAVLSHNESSSKMMIDFMAKKLVKEKHEGQCKVTCIELCSYFKPHFPRHREELYHPLSNIICGNEMRNS